jgi:nucleotide-binding universal stress UspA family protein
MYNTILVPLDGSRRAEAVLRHVEELALRYAATVILIRVVDLAPPIGVAEQAYARLRQNEMERKRTEAASYLAGMQGIFREKGIATRTRVVYGPVVAAIIAAAQRENADLIALASHGWSGLSRVFYGSVAAGVLQRIDRPLLLVRSQETD